MLQIKEEKTGKKKRSQVKICQVCIHMRDALTRRRKPDKERGFLPPILYQYWLSLLLSLSPSLYSRNLLHVVFLLDDWTETLEAGKHQTGACYFPLVYHSLPWGKPQTFSVQRQDFWTLDWQKGRIYHIYSSLILKSESALIIISSLKIKLIKRLWVFFILLSFFFFTHGDCSQTQETRLMQARA